MPTPTLNSSSVAIGYARHRNRKVNGTWSIAQKTKKTRSVKAKFSKT